jgi:hypothetical protein
MQTTTAAILREQFISEIQEISPAHPHQQFEKWKAVEQMMDVPGDKIRLFYVLFGFPATAPDDSIWSCSGITLECEVQIYTNYGGLPDKEIDGVVAEDGRQLYLALERRLDPQFVGLTTVRYQSFTPEADEPGHVWGSHDFVIRYLAGGSS